MNTKTFNRNSLLSQSPESLTANTIILPKLFWSKTVEMCNGNTEKAGWLICKKVISGYFICYIVEYIFITDEGSLGSVFPTKRLNLPDEYAGIEFHIHPSGLGNFWFDKFSNGDYDTFMRRLSADTTYKHVLFTPTNILTFGNESPNFIIANGNEEANIAILYKESEWKSLTEKSTVDPQQPVDDLFTFLMKNSNL